MTILVKLVAKETDPSNYTTYVFECLDKEVASSSKYIMCTRYPNWEHRVINLGEIGYLNFVEIRAGIDKWFDGKQMIPYYYNGIQFIKFILKPEKKDYEYVM